MQQSNHPQSEFTYTPISLETFKRKFRNLILAAWMLPPVVGLLFILFIGVLTPEQMLGILLTPTEPAYIIGWLFFALWYFPRQLLPLENYIEQSTPDSQAIEAALKSIRAFPLHFWGIFLIYLVLAPASVIWSAEYFTDYVARPVDWFRIELVALIVSIIVGLPIFFMILDLFGNCLGEIKLKRPHITVKTKVFLIGALVPLLIDTMLVQYYWTRTGYFTLETFIVWLVLELLAIGASLIFVRSFAQSLVPLEGLSFEQEDQKAINTKNLMPTSTDEIGVLTVNYRELLENLQSASEVLELRNKVLREYGRIENFNEVADAIVQNTQQALGAEKSFLLLLDEDNQQLIGVSQTDAPYRAEGYYTLDLNEISMAVMVHNQRQTYAIPDVQNDPRCSPEMRSRFNVQSALASPLLLAEKSIGVLMVVNSEHIHEYTQYEIKLLENLASEAAVVVHGRQLHHQHVISEEEKLEREQQIELLMDSTEEGIYGVDPDGNCTFINRAAIQMLGYKDENEILGQSIHEKIHHSYPDGTYYPKEECNVRLATKRGESGHSAEEVHWRKDGTSFPIEYWSHPVVKNGKTVGTVVTFIDITERLRTENELSQHRNHLEELIKERTIELERQATIIDQIHDSVVATDMNGTITSWNKGAEKLFGYSQQEALGKNISFVYPPEEINFLQSEVIAPLLEKKEHEVEVLMRRKSGEDFDAHLSLSIQYDENLVAVGMIGYSMDISQRKVAERKLEQQAAELEAANKELEAFSYSVSHDLRAPLRAIDGFSLAILEDYSDALDSTGQDYLQRVRSGTQRMGMLIDDMLQLSRVTRSSFKRQKVELGNIASEIVERLKHTEPGREVEFSCVKDLTCMGDEQLLEILLENLLSNAWKYSSKNEHAVIEFGSKQEDHRTVFYIKDNGVGFDMEYASNLFVAFKRLHNTSEFEGTGIGLATVQRIISRHNGKIWAEAEVGVGAIFYFTL